MMDRKFFSNFVQLKIETKKIFLKTNGIHPFYSFDQVSSIRFNRKKGGWEKGSETVRKGKGAGKG